MICYAVQRTDAVLVLRYLWTVTRIQPLGNFAGRARGCDWKGLNGRPPAHGGRTVVLAICDNHVLKRSLDEHVVGYR